MRLLFITQKVDRSDDLLGVYHEWIKELALRAKQIHVICLYEGESDLPSNVFVYSLGKEIGRSRLKYLWRFFVYLWRRRSEYDEVFVHMNPEYVVLAGWWWRLTRKKITFWYAHYLKTWQLVIASWFADQILTSVTQAFPFSSLKVKAVGQGIDVERFCLVPRVRPSQPIRLLFVGRISPVKDLLTLIEAARELQSRQIPFVLNIVGEPGEKDHQYFDQVKLKISQAEIDDRVFWLRKRPNNQMPEIYQEHDLYINLTRTGSFDKTTLEAMACGCLVLTANQAFFDVLPALWSDDHVFREGDPIDLADRISGLLGRDGLFWSQRGQDLRDIIVENHSLKRLMNKLI